jgi:bifunctional non-homologous end joining protein LigD
MKANLKLTHPHKILYPEKGITKRELRLFYGKICDWILPYIVNRPLTLLRCPQGREKGCFYQKHFYGSLEPLCTIDIQEKEKIEPYVYIQNEIGLMTLIQLNTLEIHMWGSHVNFIEKPDLITFDLDPAPEIEWKEIVKATYFIREQLEGIHLKSFVKTTGGKGLHIVLPIKPHYSWEKIKIFSQQFVNYLVSLKPEQYISSASKLKRKGKIYIDYLRNERGATAIAPYSIRAKENAPMAIPIDWKELPRLRSNTYTIDNLLERLAHLKHDPWEDFFNNPQSMTRFFK